MVSDGKACKAYIVSFVQIGIYLILVFLMIFNIKCIIKNISMIDKKIDVNVIHPASM